jgi:hypothetical protein
MKGDTKSSFTNQLPEQKENKMVAHEKLLEFRALPVPYPNSEQYS